MTGWCCGFLPFFCSIFLTCEGTETGCLGEARASKSKSPINADRTKNFLFCLALILVGRTCFEFLNVFKAG